jgi:hypothetical protein
LTPSTLNDAEKPQLMAFFQREREMKLGGQRL